MPQLSRLAPPDSCWMPLISTAAPHSASRRDARSWASRTVSVMKQRLRLLDQTIPGPVHDRQEEARIGDSAGPGITAPGPAGVIGGGKVPATWLPVRTLPATPPPPLSLPAAPAR